MSRRRATEVHGDEENVLNQDQQLRAEKTPFSLRKSLRYAKRRPVTSFLILVVLCSVAFATAALFNLICKYIFTSNTSPAHGRAHGDQRAQFDHDSAFSDKQRNRLAGDEDTQLRVHDPADEAESDQSMSKKDASKVDKVSDSLDTEHHHHGTFSHDQNRGNNSVSSHNCMLRFKSGKLGSKSPLCVTDSFFFDIAIGGKKIGRFVIGVFGEVVPKSAANFRALATCTGVLSNVCYKGDSFHRIVPGFVVQGGSKATGRSIFGPTFREEQSPAHHSFLQHNQRGVLAWAEYPIGSQFYILLRDDARYLDANHVVFGVVLKGMNVVDQIASAQVTNDRPVSHVSIWNCGDVSGSR